MMINLTNKNRFIKKNQFELNFNNQELIINKEKILIKLKFLHVNRCKLMEIMFNSLFLMQWIKILNKIMIKVNNKIDNKIIWTEINQINNKTIMKIYKIIVNLKYHKNNLKLVNVPKIVYIYSLKIYFLHQMIFIKIIQIFQLHQLSLQ
jgi:hypothetical protein